jgi:hypothetical protein
LTFYYRTLIPKLKILRFISNLNSSLIFWKNAEIDLIFSFIFWPISFFIHVRIFFTLFIQNRGFLLAISYSRNKQKIWNKITWLLSIDFWHHRFFLFVFLFLFLLSFLLLFPLLVKKCFFSAVQQVFESPSLLDHGAVAKIGCLNTFLPV